MRRVGGTTSDSRLPAVEPAREATRRAVVQEFRAHWQADPALIVRAPGRVNLIGEHTDYNEGFVLPMAIDRAAWIALQPRRDRRVVVHSTDFGETVEFALGAIGERGTGWGEYLKGVAWSLGEAGHDLQGWEGVLGGDVPIGAGLSSSAAVEVAAARAFAAVSGIPWEPVPMARLAQRAENEWVGVQCGIMDQLASIGGLAGHALLIDCRTLEPSPVPLPAETAVLVLDTGTRRGLVGSAYDERRRQCQEAADFFGARALRDVSLEDLSRAGHRLPQTTLRRARHVISENQRTLAAAQAMRRGDAARMGELMNASHQSLRTDFEVSSPELDAITDCARRAEGCLGARLTGAGFAGCAVALVRREDLASFTETLRSCYRAATEKEAAPYVCAASPGASVER